MNGPEIMPFGKKGRYEEKSGAEPPKKRPLHKKVLLAIVILLGAELVNITLWQLGEIPACPSIFVSEILTAVIGFLTGRIYERFCR